MKDFKNSLLVAGGCLFAVGLMASAGRADYISSDTRLPAPRYQSTNQVIYASGHRIDSFFDVFADFQRIPEPTGLPTETHSFFDVFTELSLAPPGGASSTYQVAGTMQMRLNGLPPGTPYPHIYQVEMLQLDLQGGTLPSGVMIRESPTLVSAGTTTIADMGGGMYYIDSFFDVFTELTLDGGQNWLPSSGSSHHEGSPEPSSFLLALIGAAVMGWRSCCRRLG